MNLIVYHLHEHKLQADSRVILWLSTDVNECHTPAAPSEAYFEKPAHMPFLEQQSMRRHPLHTPRICQKLALD